MYESRLSIIKHLPDTFQVTSFAESKLIISIDEDVLCFTSHKFYKLKAWAYFFILHFVELDYKTIIHTYCKYFITSKYKLWSHGIGFSFLCSMFKMCLTWKYTKHYKQRCDIRSIKVWLNLCRIHTWMSVLYPINNILDHYYL